MDTLKAGKPLIDFVKHCYDANLPPLLVGRHGVGKSQLLEQLACQLGIRYICRDLSLMEPPDLTGLPVVESQSTVYRPPEFLPRDGRGLLVFEELNRCEKYMQAPCLQLLTTRTLNDYKLPPGWLPAAAINPADDDEYLVNAIDPALLSRFAQVQVEPDQEQWLEWARRNDVHSRVIGYVSSDPSIFDHPDSSPRSWTYVSNSLKAAEQHQTSSQSLRAAVLGLVGDKRGAAFLRTLKQTERPLTAVEITNSYDNNREAVKRWMSQGRIELVELSLQSLLKFLQPQAEYEEIRNAPSQWANIRHFLSDLPGDLACQAESSFQERGYRFPVLRRRVSEVSA